MKSSDTPIVSILLPTFNRAATLSRAIESIFSQTFLAWELLVIDDGSTDGTAALLASFAARDSRVRILKSPGSTYAVSGITGQLNQGLAAARGKYIARLDDDDYWIDGRKLEKQAAYLDSHPDCVVVGGGMIVIDADGKELYRYFKKETDAEIRKTALYANPFSHTTVMFRKDAAAKVGGYGPWRYAEDWDLWLTLGQLGTFYNFQEYFTAYLLAGQNISFIHQRGQSRMVLGFIIRHRHEYPGFFGAYVLNFGQYLFSFLPVAVRIRMHAMLSSLKRRSF